MGHSATAHILRKDQHCLPSVNESLRYHSQGWESIPCIRIFSQLHPRSWCYRCRKRCIRGVWSSYQGDNIAVTRHKVDAVSVDAFCSGQVCDIRVFRLIGTLKWFGNITCPLGTVCSSDNRELSSACASSDETTASKHEQTNNPKVEAKKENIKKESLCKVLRFFKFHWQWEEITRSRGLENV